MNTFLIIPNKNKDADYEVSTRVAKMLKERGATLYILDEYGTDLSGYAIKSGTVPLGVELIIVVGGDGSVIDASVIAVENDLPIVAVNLGNLGYLSEIELSELSLLDRLFTGEYKIEEKLLLSVSVNSGGVAHRSERFAVNDVIISHETYVGLAQLSLTDSNGASVKYRADGLIMSTPAGSTAYSLSAGGPLVSHDIDCIMATPICPHSFFNRSVIFNPTESLTLKNIGESGLNVSVDGRYFTMLEAGQSCVVRAAVKRFKMLTFSENNMFSTLFGKMKRFENI